VNRAACALALLVVFAFWGRMAAADVLPAVPSTDTSCDAAEAAELRAHLSSQKHKADRWNLVWRLTFTGASVATIAVGVANPFPSLQAGMYASGGKAAIGALARWILPLRVHVPAESADVCADVLALRKELRKVGRNERALFLMGHIGGLLVNLGGAAYVWYADSGSKALLSIAVGYPIGLLSNYTMPRGAWHKYREATWTLPMVTVVPQDDGWVVGLSGAF
jgi:hypothetical protein